MKEAIIIPVMNPKDDDEHELRIEYEDNVLSFNLDGKLLFDGDFNGNFKEIFQRALEIWG